MKSYRKILLLTPLLFTTLLSLAQETCDDGLDNDNDGFIDCYDGDCANDADCSSFYFGNAVVCRNEPTDNPTFNIKQQWGSPNRTANNSSLPAVGDIDGDGIPEVVVSNRSNNRLTILNGIDGTIEKSIYADPKDSYYISHDVTIANLDGDECGEIFMAGAYTSGTITAYDCELNLLWETTVPDNRTGAISVADFDQDGVAELMVGNGIYNAKTGAAIISPTSPMATTNFYGTTAVDILPDSECADCQGLEMVAGGIIYSINIATGTRTVVKEVNDLLNGNNRWRIDDYSGYYNMNFSAVADYNQDGNTNNPRLDVLFNGKDYNGDIVIFFWDLANNTVTTFKDLNDKRHWLGTGRINISDLDNDGQLNASFVSDQTLYALDENFNKLWTKGITEGSSGITGCSVFDFNDDGAAEVLYRSETTLHIIDGTDGSSRMTKACISLTWDEYPIVADVDGDGASEICLACATSNSSNKYSSTDGQIRVYESDGEDWQPSRTVWNQHAYFNVNVNDNLTIPVVQQNPGAVFSTNVCTSGPNRPLNTFLNQAPILNDEGCPSYVSPDLELLDNITATSPQCPDTDFVASFGVRNSGDIALTTAFPVTFYAGDPRVSGSTKLNTAIASIENLDLGETATIELDVIGPGGAGFELFVSINDNGSQNPPITTFQGTMTECDNTNNLASTTVTSLSFELFASKVKDNELCDPTFSDNGEASAYYVGTLPASTSIIWQEDFEDLSDGDIEDTGTTAWSRVYNDDGSAQVATYNGSKKFRVRDADTEVVWTSEEIDISNIDEIDISWDINETGGHENADYIRLYYVVDNRSPQALNNGIFNNDYGSKTATANFTNLFSGVKGQKLVLRAEILNSSSNENDYLDNIVVTGTTNAVTGNLTTGASFQWFNGTDFASGPVFTGASVTDMPHGTYSVFAILDGNACPSDTATVVIDLIEQDPVIKINKLAPLTDCATPNGQLEAVVIVDGVEVTNGYNFTWYLGNDFIDTVSVASIASNLEARTYTVVAQNKISGCTSNLDEVVDTNLTLPGIQLETKTDITACNNLNGGSITVSSGGFTTDYTFNWYNGTEVKAVPDFTGVAGAGATYSGITFGFYTVEAVQTEGSNPSNCKSAPLTIEIENLTGAPAAEFTTIHNSSCGSGNGSITATSGGTATGFTFDFYSGVSTSPSDKITTNLSGENNSIAGSLPDGDYTVVITNSSNGCSVQNVVTLNDISSNPDILDTDIDVTDRTACNGGGADPDNGMIDAVGTASGGSGNYEYILWSGAASGNPLATNNTGLFEQLGSGNYSLKVRDLDTDCLSDVSDIRINLVRDEPIIGLASSTENTNCNTGNGTLSVTATSGISEPISGYEFSIYQGNNTQAANLLQGPIAVADGSVGHTFTGLLGGNYRVYILNVGNNCDQTEDFIINDNISIPVFEPLIVTNQRSCNSPNGALDARIDDSGDGISNYDFVWYAGDQATGPVIGTSNMLDNRAAGQYTVVATDKTSGCSSSPLTGTVGEQLELPIVETEIVNAQTNCSNPNGQLKAYTTDPSFPGVEFTDNHTFVWYVGNSASGTPISAGVDPGNGSNPTFPVAGEEHTIGGLVAGTYTVEVTSDNSGCAVTQTITLTDNIILPVISSANVTDNSGCTGNFTGSIEAAVTYNGGAVTLPDADYTFTWYSGIGTGGAVLSTGSTNNVLSNLQDGDYTVTVTNNAVGCTSDPQTYTVNLSPGAFDIVVDTQSPNTNCTGTANGHLIASIEIGNVAQNTADYTFEWFEGANTTTNLTAPETESGTNNSEAINLNAGEYTVRATNIASGCSFTASATISDVNATLAVTGSATTGATDCAAGNGSITINEITQTANGVSTTIAGAATIDADFDLELLNASLTSLGNITNPSAATLSPGTYYVVATYTAGSGCESTPFQFTIADNSINPVINIVEDAPDAACTGGTGSGGLSASVDESAQGGGAAVTANYSFQWYVGSDLNNTTTPVPNGNGGNTASITNMEGGDYFVVVTDNATPNNGCSARLSFTLSEDNPAYTIQTADVTLAHISECTGATTGSATVNDVLVDGVSNGGTTGFTFELTDNMGASLSTNATGVFTGLTNGTYYVIATNTNTNCESVPLQFDILDQSVQPQLSITVDANNTDCAGGGNGQLTVSVDNPDGGTYSYTWHSGADVNVNNPIGQTTATATGLDNGDYWVLVEDDNSPGSCFAKISASIIDDPADLSVDAATAVATDQCNPQNGSITITQMTEDGTTYTAATDMQPYTFTLYESDGTTAVAPDPFTQATATDLPVATGLDAGTYFVTVTNALTCQSGQTQVIVGTNTTAPALTITEVAPNGTCAGATNPVGSLQVTVDNDDSEDYTYQWYVGSGTGTPVVDGVNANGSNVPAGEPQMETISGLVEGVYTVVVTDNESTASAGLGCSASATFTLSKDTPTYTVNAASTTHIQHCTVDDTGVYEVTDVSVNGTPTGGVAGFTFKFFDNLGTELTTGNPASVTVTGANISGLTPGNYSVEITNTTTNCSSANIPFEIQDNSQAPVLSITVDQNNTSCGAANGSLTANIVFNDGGTYSYTWYNGNNLSDTSSPLGQTTATATGLDNGDYWVLVTDTSDPNNTCSAKIAGTIIDDPADLSVDAATAVATDQCNPQNGSITITQMTEDGTTYTAATDMQPYTFTLYESDGTTAVAPDPFTQATATDLPVATGLDAGTYFVTVTNALTCQSGQTQVIVGTNTTAPALTITEVAPNGTCAGATNPVGSLQVTVDNDDSEDYTYQWYVGSGTGTPVVDGVNANGSNVPAGEPQMETISGLVEGVYTVVVTDNESTASAGLGCSASATFTLSKDTPTYTVNAASTTHIQHCTVDDTGVYEVTDVSVNGTPTGGVAGFTFKFFDNLGTELTTGNPASVTVTGANISGLTPGNYSVEITNTTTNCSSANIPFEIQDNSQAPVLSITVDQNNTSCGAANGSLTANIVFNDGGTYSYTWYNGNNLSDTSSPLGQTTATATGLDNGDYWVLVTDTSDPNNTCSAKIAGTIIDDPADLSVDAATAVATDQCNPQNGSITITQMTEDGTTYTAATDMQPYTFTLYESDGTTAVAPDPFTQATATDLPVATGLDAGTYFVTVTNALTCQSGQTQVIVGTNTTAPALTITEVAPNGTCAGATNPVGSLQVTVDNDDTEAYTYQWYVGSGTGTPVVDGVNANGSNVPAGEPQMATISGLVEGVYTVVVTDNESTASAGLGCSASATFTLSKDTPTYTVNAASTTHIQHCTVDDTGVYEVTDVSVNGTPTGGVNSWYYHRRSGRPVGRCSYRCSYRSV